MLSGVWERFAERSRWYPDQRLTETWVQTPILSVFLLWMSIPIGGEEGEGRCLRQEVAKGLESTLRFWFLYKLPVKEREFGRTLSSSSYLPPFHSCQNFLHEPNIGVFWKEAFLHKTQKWQVLNPSPANTPASWQGLRMNKVFPISPHDWNLALPLHLISAKHWTVTPLLIFTSLYV